MAYERLKANNGWYPNVQAAAELVSRFSVWGLGGSDGCLCCHFIVHGISVDVSCRKSEHSVRVHGVNGPATEYPQFFALANLILAQIAETGADAEDFAVRFCDYKADNVNGRWQSDSWVKDYACCYCGEVGRPSEAYLCSRCTSNGAALESYPPELLAYKPALMASASED